MDKLDQEVIMVCNQLTEKPGRGVILFVVEPDGVHENGVIYGYHAECAGDSSKLLRTLVQLLSLAFQKIIHKFLGKV